MQHHPDRNQHNKAEAEEVFKRISHAYTILSNPHQRACYDATGGPAHSPAAAAAAARRASPFGGVGFDHRPLSPEEAEELSRIIFHRRTSGSSRSGGGGGGGSSSAWSRPRRASSVLRALRALLSRLPF